jgi:hypothetical protein
VVDQAKAVGGDPFVVPLGGMGLALEDFIGLKSHPKSGARTIRLPINIAYTE